MEKIRQGLRQHDRKKKVDDNAVKTKVSRQAQPQPPDEQPLEKKENENLENAGDTKASEIEDNAVKTKVPPQAQPQPPDEQPQEKKENEKSENAGDTKPSDIEI